MQKTPALQKSMGTNIETKEKSPILYFTPPPFPTMDTLTPTLSQSTLTSSLMEPCPDILSLPALSSIYG